MSNVEVLKIEAGTTIKLNGIPFQLISDTEVLGLRSNLDLSMREDNPEDKKVDK